MSDFNSLLKKYKKFDFIQSKEEFDEAKINFVHHSNRLEGSNLTLLQTEEIITSNKSKDGLSIIDGLMAIDHYRALNQALVFGVNKYPLSEKIVLKIHETLLKNSFEIDPFYENWKLKGQELGKYKVKSNRILFQQNKSKTYYDTPSPEESKELILNSISLYENSSVSFLEKIAKLVQNIYNAHAFFDGNKRMTRLIIANQLLANELPLIVLHSYGNDYNIALIEGFINKTHQPIFSVLEKSFNQYLSQQIELLKQSKKPNNRGFGLIL